MNSLLRTALEYRRAGLDVIPDHPQAKYPQGVNDWQRRQFTESDLTEWIGQRGYVIGVRNVEGLDFDNIGRPQASQLLEEWRNLVEDHAPGLVGRLLIERTRRAGYHVVFRCDTIEGNQKLAQRPATPQELEDNPKERIKTLIETRGQGGQFVVAPSPGYALVQGDWLNLPTVTPQERKALLVYAKMLDRAPQPQTTGSNGTGPGDRPGDVYNEQCRNEAFDLLTRDGWTVATERNGAKYLVRPGKRRGISATFGYVAPGVLRVFSTNAAPFEAEKCYAPFAIYSELEHSGDYKAAAKALASRFGMKYRNDTGAEQSQNGNAEAEKKRVPTHDELAERWLEKYPLTAYGLGDWRRYQAGLWPAVSDLAIKREVKNVLKRAKIEGVKPTTALVGSVSELAKYDVAEENDIWDANPDYLVCKNGTLHIPTRTLQPHDPDLYATSGVNYDFDSDATAPGWDRLLIDLSGSISPGVVDFLQEFAGYALTTDTQHEIAVWLYGPPGSGKSTVLTGLEAMLGDRAGLLGLADIERSRFALANIPGKTLAIATEQPGSFITSTHILNAIVSGETVTVDRKFRDPIEVLPRCKIAWAMNELPRVADANSGLFRRVKVIEFSPLPESKRDPALKEQIKTEGAGILNWALSGLDRLRQRRHFYIPAEIATATDNFKQNNDIPARFVEECCYVGVDANNEPFRVQSSHLYRAYKDWCIESGHKPQSSTSIASEWKRLGFDKRRIAGPVFYFGVGLRAENV